MYRALCLALLFTAKLSAASSPDAKAVVEKNLTEPLTVKENRRSRLSRVIQPPAERQVRIEGDAKKDESGAEFFTFAIDARHGWFEDDEKNKGWVKSSLTGCVYADRGEVFVKMGKAFRPAEILLGKKVAEADASICRPASGKLARK